jgi:hypothetical protein
LGHQLGSLELYSGFRRSLGGILEGPLLGLPDGTCLVLLPEVSDLLIQWVFEIGGRQKGLDGEQHRSDLKRWGPLVLDDVQADSAQLVDIWVVDLGDEKHLWWHHWVLVWQEEFAVEKTSLVRSLSWAGNLDVEMSEVLVIWLSINADHWVLGQSLSLLKLTNIEKGFIELTLRILGGIAIFS